MATNPVNLVDAIAEQIPRMARTRSAATRLGWIKTAPAFGAAFVRVTVGAGDVLAGYPENYLPKVGDQVLLLNDRDNWYVVEKLSKSSLLGNAQYVNVFTLDPNPSAIASGASPYRNFVQSAHRFGDPWIVRAGNAQYIDCAVPGIYQFSFYQRTTLGARLSTGYMQGATEGQLALDILINQGGSLFTDVALTSHPFGAIAGNSLRFRVYNQTGGAGTLGTGWFSITRLGGS